MKTRTKKAVLKTVKANLVLDDKKILEKVAKEQIPITVKTAVLASKSKGNRNDDVLHALDMLNTNHQDDFMPATSNGIIGTNGHMSVSPTNADSIYFDPTSDGEDYEYQDDYFLGAPSSRFDHIISSASKEDLLTNSIEQRLDANSIFYGDIYDYDYDIDIEMEQLEDACTDCDCDVGCDFEYADRPTDSSLMCDDQSCCPVSLAGCARALRYTRQLVDLRMKDGHICDADKTLSMNSDPSGTSRFIRYVPLSEELAEQEQSIIQQPQPKKNASQAEQQQVQNQAAETQTQLKTDLPTDAADILKYCMNVLKGTTEHLTEKGDDNDAVDKTVAAEKSLIASNDGRLQVDPKTSTLKTVFGSFSLDDGSIMASRLKEDLKNGGPITSKLLNMDEDTMNVIKKESMKILQSPESLSQFVEEFAMLTKPSTSNATPISPAPSDSSKKSKKAVTGGTNNAAAVSTTTTTNGGTTTVTTTATAPNGNSAKIIENIITESGIDTQKLRTELLSMMQNKNPRSKMQAKQYLKRIEEVITQHASNCVAEKQVITKEAPAIKELPKEPSVVAVAKEVPVAAPVPQKSPVTPVSPDAIATDHGKMSSATSDKLKMLEDIYSSLLDPANVPSTSRATPATTPPLNQPLSNVASLLSELRKANLLKDRLEVLCRDLSNENHRLKLGLNPVGVLLPPDDKKGGKKKSKGKEQANNSSGKTAEKYSPLSVPNMPAPTWNEVSFVPEDDGVLASLDRDRLLEVAKLARQQYNQRECQYGAVLTAERLETHLAQAQQAMHALALHRERTTSALLTRRLNASMAAEQDLRAQLTVYMEKFRQVEDTLARSNDLFGAFRAEIASVGAKLNKSERECSALKAKNETLSRNILTMAEEREKQSQLAQTLQKQKDKLESLCRTLQAERKKDSSTAVPTTVEKPAAEAAKQ